MSWTLCDMTWYVLTWYHTCTRSWGQITNKHSGTPHLNKLLWNHNISFASVLSPSWIAYFAAETICACHWNILFANWHLLMLSHRKSWWEQSSYPVLMPAMVPCSQKMGVVGILFNPSRSDMIPPRASRQSGIPGLIYCSHGILYYIFWIDK